MTLNETTNTEYFYFMSELLRIGVHDNNLLFLSYVHFKSTYTKHVALINWSQIKLTLFTNVSHFTLNITLLE